MVLELEELLGELEELEELDELEEPEPDELLEGVVLVVVEEDEELELELDGVHVPEMNWVPAGAAWEGDVPGGTGMVSVSGCPVRRFLTVIVHVSASAGPLPTASAMSSAAASATAPIRLRRKLKAACLLRTSWFVRAPMRNRKHPATGDGSY